MFTGRTFSDLSRHPNQVNRGGGYASAAAGAYQFLPATWDGAAKKLGLQDFSPANQDAAALQLIRDRGVDPDKPLTRETLAKLAPEWASLPTLQGASYYGQPVKAADKLLSYYQERLGGGGATMAPSAAPATAAPAPTSSQPGFSLGNLAAGILGDGGRTGSFRMADPFALIPKTASTGTGDPREVADAILGSGFARTAGKQRMAASSALLPGLFKATTGVSLDDILPAMKAAGALAVPQPTPGLQVPQMGLGGGATASAPAANGAMGQGQPLRVGRIAHPHEDIFPTTGPHLHVEVINPEGKHINPALNRTLLQGLRAGGRPLFENRGGDLAPSFPITSPYGPRNAPTAGASTYHRGKDLAIGADTPLEWAGPGSYSFEGGVGTISTPEGWRIRLLHTKPS
jgi:hypothetical protein